MSEPDAFKISEAVIDLWRCYTIERDMAKELEAENARLKAEVERLRKAGDAMVDYIERTESSAYYIEPDGGDRIAEWLAAKEGNPSK